jgi:subfamily B ATP-binding cassette protein MsbA
MTVDTATTEGEGRGLEVYLRLLRYVVPHWRVASAAVAGMIVAAATEAGFAWLIKPLLDEGFVERDTTVVRLVPLGIMGAFVIRGIASFAADYGTSWISRHVIAQLRYQVFDRLLAMPRRFYDEASSGMLLSKLTYNVEQVAQAGSKAIVILVRDGATIIFLMAYMAFISWRLALIFLALGPVLGFVVIYISKRFRRLSHRIQRSVGGVAYVAEEAIEGSDVVKIFGGEEQERRRFDRVNERNKRQFLKFAATKALSTPVVQFCAAASLSLVIYLATLDDVIRTISVGSFVSFVTAMLLLLQPIKRLTNVQAIIQKGIAAGDSIFTLLDTPVEDDHGSYEVDRVAGRIDFDAVTFRYRTGTDPVLTNFNLTIEPCQTVAIVGRSGSGKTTLANLLPRFYEVEDGEIRLDGVGLRDYRLACLRRQMALVSQQVVLFNDTIAANIGYGVADPSREDVREAARAANALSFIDALPDGLDTMVGENGVMLSGGQRQRIAIARALVKDAPVLILDEATSALDTESENEIQKALEKLMQGRTTLVIAHRLSTIENADRIVVLDAGRVVETGTHSELMAHGGSYAALQRLQQGSPGKPAGDPS